MDKVLYTVIVTGIAVFSFMRYRKLNRSYDRGREQIKSDRSFKYIYSGLIALVLVFTVASYWASYDWLVKMHDSSSLRLLGLVLTIFGIALFEWSARSLGNQYSPCFDLRKPTHRVTRGPYQFLQHPMYFGNLLVLLGLWISSGSLWVVIIFAVVAAYYWRSAHRERNLLISFRD